MHTCVTLVQNTNIEHLVNLCTELHSLHAQRGNVKAMTVAAIKAPVELNRIPSFSIEEAISLVLLMIKT